jgi:hypothetical protein
MNSDSHSLRRGWQSPDINECSWGEVLVSEKLNNEEGNLSEKYFFH